MNKQFFFSVALVLLSPLAFGQGAAFDYADDAFRYSDFSQTERPVFGVLAATMLLWVAMPVTCLVMPAGSGLLQPLGVKHQPNVYVVQQSKYISGPADKQHRGKLSIGQFGLDSGGRYDNGSRRWRRTAFGVTYSQSANFFDYTDVRGLNNNPNSSIAQTYVNAANMRLI